MVKSKCFGDVKIYHFRNYDKDGTVSIKGGVTLAFADVNGKIICGVAKCSRKDNFSRKMGRAIAIGRIEVGKGTTCDEFVELPIYEEAQIIGSVVMGHTKMDVRG